MARPAAAARKLHLQWHGCSAAAAGLAFALVVGAGGTSGDPRNGPLGDLLQIVVTQRALLAVDGEGGGRSEALERGEQVLWNASRGRVGVALTDRRILAVTTRSAAWQTTRYRRGESRPETAELGDRVALILTDRRILGFDGGSGNLVEASVGPRERVLDARVGANVAVVVTSRRALGLSAASGGFFAMALRLGEEVEGFVAASEVATLTTSHRLLIFQGRTGSWSERHLELR